MALAFLWTQHLVSGLPALVLKPVATIGMKTGSACNLVFRDEVVDYDGNRACAPTDGVPAEGCTAGDLSKISFSTEPLVVGNSVPADGATGVALNASAFMLISFNANLDPATVASITMTEGGNPIALNATVEPGDPTTVVIMQPADFLPDTTYVITVGTGVTDLLGGAIPAQQTITFTTGS
jgi:hypothetical protein